MKTIQQELVLFQPSSFEEIAKARNIPRLTVTFSKRLRKSWHLTISPDKNKKLTLPYLIKDAPDTIKNSILEWTSLVKPRLKSKRKEYYHEKKKLESIVWNYLTEQGVTYTKRRILDTDIFFPNTKGSAYDLREIFNTINQRYFKGTIRSFIRWGAYASKTSYLTYFIDQFKEKQNLITIAGAYDHPEVPKFAINGVVFHEMLHIVYPRYLKNCRNVIHGPEFKKAERMYPFHDRWLMWERDNMYKIIRSLKRKKRSC